MKYLILPFLIVLIGCTAPKKQIPKKGVITKIAILHTNDTHGDLNYFPRMKTVANQVRKEVDTLFILNGGDIFSGNPFTDKYQEPGFPMIDLMNKIGYDLSVIGNHDFDYGQPVLKKRMKEANFPFILANITQKSPEIKSVKPYHILKTQNGISLAVVGVLYVGNKLHPQTLKQNTTGIQFSKPEDAIKKLLHLQKKQPLLLLSHLGIESDREIAERFPEIDLIVGGHSHTKLEEPEMIGKTMIVQAGGNGRFVGKILLTFKDGVLMKKEATLIPLNNTIIDDPEVKKAVKTFHNNPYLTETVGEASQNFSGKTAIGHLMTTSYRHQLKTDFAIINGGGIRHNRLKKGKIARHNLYRIDPFNNDLVTLSLTPDELKRIVMKKIYNNRLSIKLSGFQLVVEQKNCNAKKIGKVVKTYLIDHNKKPLEPTQSYTVSMSRYVGEHIKKPVTKKLHHTTLKTTKALINYIQAVKTISPDYRYDLIRKCNNTK